MKIVKTNIKNINELIELELMLYKKHTFDELLDETKKLMQTQNNIFFSVYEKEIMVAFAHISLKAEYVEGANFSPTGYLEGIFVLPEYRRKKIASKLVQFCQKYLKDNNCFEFASDCKIDNEISYKFHLKNGFIETSRNIHFIKKI